MGELLAEKILRERPDHDIDVVIPIPDTSRTSALQVAQLLGVKYREGFIKNRYIGRTFIMPGQEQRAKSVRSKLNAIDLEFRDKNVLLVDDSIVRGTTSAQIIELAREAGAQGVYFASAAPPVRYPNVYGIDMPAASRAGRGRPHRGRGGAGSSAPTGSIYQDLDDLVRACSTTIAASTSSTRRASPASTSPATSRPSTSRACRRSAPTWPRPSAARWARPRLAQGRRRPLSRRPVGVHGDAQGPDHQRPAGLPAAARPSRHARVARRAAGRVRARLAAAACSRASPVPPTTSCCSTTRCRAGAASNGSTT